MNRQRFCLAGGILLLIAGAAQAAVYDNIYWVGGNGEWTGDVTASPEYSTGNWSTDPNAASGLPAKFVLGRNDGLRVGQAIGAGGFDLDRVPCNEPGCTTTPIPGGTQLGTDIYITNGATVHYNPNRMFLTGDDGLDRFGDFRIQADANFPGTPTLNLSGGSTFNHQTTFGGDLDGMWTRWNGAELNIDDATFNRTGDVPNGFASGAWMFASFHGFDNSVQTVHITNGGRFYNEGQAWFGQSDTAVAGGNANNVRVVVTINDGEFDFTKGDEYGLDNDGLLLRSDLAFVYNHKPNGDANPADDERFVINFTGPGSITVDGDHANPLDGDTTTGGGGIRVARQTGALIDIDPGPGEDFSAEYVGRDDQVSYQQLWDLGILRANNKSGLTGHTFSDFFSTTNNPGDTDYKLTSNVPASPAVIRGDFNRDGKVDQADYVVYAKTVGSDGYNDTASSQALLLADADGSLHVNANDLRIWQEMFGTGTPGGGGSNGVPEPGTMALFAIGLASVSLLRKRAS